MKEGSMRRKKEDEENRGCRFYQKSSTVRRKEELSQKNEPVNGNGVRDWPSILYIAF